MMTMQAILPPPFEWVHIPAGKVTIHYGEWENREYAVKRTQDFQIESFSIAKYPVTNAQYDVFIHHPDGYKNPKWWDFSDDAKKWRAGRPEMEKSTFDGGDCPREMVSWYDSVAFCLWLSAMTDEKIMLPTEQQWQRAAIGDTNRIYPWGDTIDDSYLNYAENIGRTTPVTQYPEGASPYGVMDMAGNVWEWCLTEHETGNNDLFGAGVRVLRGGSWHDSGVGWFRASFRDRVTPNSRYNNWGFRIAQNQGPMLYVGR